MAGQKLKVPTYKMTLWIDKSDNTLTLKADNEVLKTYVVATGTNNSTPVGAFKITDKLENPTWYNSGAVVPPGSPENGLGTRWMGITAKGYGIHGTIEPEKLGQQVTAGCVRMKNEEVEELYSWIPPGTEVTIQD
jgi:lipoprotein-anchoring transpeptidase ErfK/SrfK